MKLAAIKKYLILCALPLALSFAFVLQNYLFNRLIGIKNYSFRLIFSTFSLGLLIYTPAILFRKNQKYLYSFISTIIISMVFVSQFIYFHYSSGFLQASALRYISQTPALIGTIRTFYSWNLVFFIINIVIVLIFFINRTKDDFYFTKKQKITILSLSLIMIIFGYGFLVRAEKKEWSDASRLYKNLYDLNTVVGKMGIMNYSVEDAIKYYLLNSKISAEETAYVKKWRDERAQPPKGKNFFGIAKNKNIIIIQIESLENAVINKKINGQEITPNLNRLAREGRYFNNYYSEVGPGNTADAEFTVLNSLYPLTKNVAFIDYAKNKYFSLPKLLKQSGYRNYVLHGDVSTFWNRSNIYPNLGYEYWIEKNDYKPSRSIGNGPSDLGDEDFFIQSAEKLDSFVPPFLATLITLSSHTPFELPADIQALSLGNIDNLDNTQKNYLQSINYTDRSLGKFMEKFKESKLYDDSLFVIYGDHQSYTGITEALDNNSSRISELKKNQVPLIIFSPDSKLKGISNSPGSHLDLYPTLVNLLGILPPKSILGQDLLNSPTPIVTHRNQNSETINSILSSDLFFEASKDGVFENGKCQGLPENKPLPIDICRKIFDQQTMMTRASDIIIKGDLLDLIK